MSCDLKGAIIMSEKFSSHYDIVGSYLRPNKLKEAKQNLADGKIDQANYDEILRKEIHRVVERQAKLGLKAVTDGEFGRSWWHLDFLAGFNGVKYYDGHKSYAFHGEKTRTDNVELGGRIEYNPDHPFFKQFEYLQSIVPEGHIAKQTIPSPTMFFRDDRSKKFHLFYANWEDFLKDLALAYSRTIDRFYELGCRYLQLDDTTWAFLISKLNKTTGEERNKYLTLAKDSVFVINKMLEKVPADMTVTTHICRGNFKSTYLFSGSYDVITPYLSLLNYDEFFLEYDDERSGSFDALKDIFNGRSNVKLILGLVSSKYPDLEDEASLRAKIKEASKVVPLENLGLSTQCGFASTEEGNKLTEDEQWDKVKLVVDTAKKIWG